METPDLALLSQKTSSAQLNTPRMINLLMIAMMLDLNPFSAAVMIIFV
jgi:hypothetical protein